MDADGAADAEMDRIRLKELSRLAAYQDAVRRLHAAADAAATHISIETDLQDYDDAVVVECRR
jgi:hypothetical protein